MNSSGWTGRILLLTLSLLFLQNCGPAKLSGGATLAEESLLGSSVDLASLLKSDSEPAENVLFRAPTQKNDITVSLGAPIVENILLQKNDFSKIIWVHEPSEKIVAVGTDYSDTFTANSAGIYDVFGYRGETPYLLTRFQYFERTSAGQDLTADGVVKLMQKMVSTDGTTETYFLLMDAPSVDLKSLHWTVTVTGQTFTNQRAILIQKEATTETEVSLSLMDTSGQTSVHVYKLPASAPNTSVCALVAEGGFANLVCPSGQFIRQVTFASYGNVMGSCGSLQMGNCNSTTTMDIVKSNCLNKASCGLSASNSVFGDPCATVTKALGIQATCVN